MFGSQYFQIRHGTEVMVGEYLASTLNVLGTAMNVDQTQGTTAQSGAGYMTPASGDYLGFLSQNVLINANGQVVFPDGSVNGTTGIAPSLGAGFSALGGPLGSVPVPNLFEQMTLGYGNLPAQVGTAVSLRNVAPGGLIEIEGEPSISAFVYTGYSQLLVTGGTGAITTSTALETQLSVFNGRWRVAQTGDVIRAILKAQLVPFVAASNVRILIKLEGGGAIKAA
jgi:hypothetical protein